MVRREPFVTVPSQDGQAARKNPNNALCRIVGAFIAWGVPGHREQARLINLRHPKRRGKFDCGVISHFLQIFWLSVTTLAGQLAGRREMCGATRQRSKWNIE